MWDAGNSYAYARGQTMKRLPNFKLNIYKNKESTHLSEILVAAKLAKNLESARMEIKEFSVSLARSPNLEMITGVGTHTRVLKSTLTSDLSIKELKINPKDVLYLGELFVRFE